MDKSIIELLGQLLNSQNIPRTPNQNTSQNPQEKINPSASSYPPEASFSSPQREGSEHQNPMLNNIFQSLGNNNILPLLSSLLGKDNPLASILSNADKTQTGNPKAKDEILL